MRIENNHQAVVLLLISHYLFLNDLENPNLPHGIDGMIFKKESANKTDFHCNKHEQK